MDDQWRNPLTGRPIRRGGPTFRRLLSGCAKKTKSNPASSISKKRPKPEQASVREASMVTQPGSLPKLEKELKPKPEKESAREASMVEIARPGRPLPLALDFSKKTKLTNDHRIPAYGPWILLQRLGSGAYGDVGLYHYKKGNDNIVVKRIPFVFVDRSEVARQIGIFRALEQQCSAHFTCLVGAYSDSDFFYIVTKAIKGKVVNGYQLIRFPEKFRPEIRTQFVRSFVLAVYVLHREFMAHGDIKPENILVDLDTGNVFLIDLDGVCTGLQCNTQTYIRTRQYEPPEFSGLAKPPTGLVARMAADCWALALSIMETFEQIVRSSKAEHIIEMILDTTGVDLYHFSAPVQRRAFATSMGWLTRDGVTPLLPNGMRDPRFPSLKRMPPQT